MNLYNTKTRAMQVFEPLKMGQVSLYVCGITPYDTTHLGHAFTYTAFDVLSRYLSYIGNKVSYTQNVTDIDDDILRKATDTGVDWRELGTRWTDKFVADMKTLNIQPPTHYVVATDFIKEMQEIITMLIEKEVAYAREGNVYFDTSKDPDYGELSHYDVHQMALISRERGGNPDDPLKRNKIDFLLWQRSVEGEPSWESPWGAGRPGWHIECTAMIKNTLGAQIDIHGGGRDLIFPHHESEIAQAEMSFSPKPHVGVWMHTGMLMYEGEKMSKSLKNLVMVSDLLKKYTANEIRWMFLSHRYREIWEYMPNDLDHVRRTLTFVTKTVGKATKDTSGDLDVQLMEDFTRAMDDDLDTESVLKLVHTAAIQIGEGNDKGDMMRNAVREIMRVLGFV